MPDGESVPDYDSRPEAIRRTIEARIIDGKMQPGDRLGLKADLQKEFDVAGPTIAQALTLLTNDGLISMRRGPGGGIFVERSRPVLRMGTRRLATGSAKSLAENIEIRESLNPLLAVSAARAVDRPEAAVASLRELAGQLDRCVTVVRDPAPALGWPSCARGVGGQRVARSCVRRSARRRRSDDRRCRVPDPRGSRATRSVSASPPMPRCWWRSPTATSRRLAIMPRSFVWCRVHCVSRADAASAA